MTQSDVEHSKGDVIDLHRKASIQVLHVDDEVGFLRAAKPILEMQGNFKVETASSVEEAMQKMTDKNYDVIVSDYLMPRIDGLQFLKQLRDSGNNTPFIIFTGRGREEVAIKALNLGADRYFNKVGDPETVYCELAHGIRQTVERKEAVVEIWQREEKLRAILASSPDAITAIDLDGKIVECNLATLDLLGFSSREELIGKNGFEFVAKKDRERAMENTKEILEQGSVKNIKYSALTKDGREFFAELSSSVVRDSSGNPIGLVATTRDITERSQIEEALRESEERYRNLFENARDVTLMSDVKGNVTSINKAAVEYGFRKEEIIGNKMLKFVPKKHWPRLLKEISWIAGGKAVKGETEVNTPKGKRIAEYRGNPIILDNKVVGIQVILDDITERRKAEEELRKSKERYRALLEDTPIGISNIDIRGNLTYVNKEFEEITGYSRDEVLGKNWLNFARKQGVMSGENLKLAAKLIGRSLMGKPSTVMKFLFKRKDGGLRWVEADARLIRKHRVPIGLQGIMKDVTELKKSEKSLKEAIRETEALNEKLRVVSELTRHDIRNKLQAARNNFFLAKRELSDNPETSKLIQSIESACGEVERILDFARNYEMLGIEELAHIDTRRAIDVAVSLFSNLHGVKVLNECHGLTVLSDSLIQQLFFNLIDNSLKYGEKVTQIQIFCEKTGEQAMKLVYEDDGVGISKGEKERIFQKGHGKGTGYGLWLVREICKVYGWTIRETGKHGKGARFTITIPRLNQDGRENYYIRKLTECA